MGEPKLEEQWRWVVPVLAMLVDLSSCRIAICGNRVRRGTEQHSPDVAVLAGKRKGEFAKVKPIRSVFTHPPARLPLSFYIAVSLVFFRDDAYLDNAVLVNLLYDKPGLPKLDALANMGNMP